MLMMRAAFALLVRGHVHDASKLVEPELSIFDVYTPEAQGHRVRQRRVPALPGLRPRELPTLLGDEQHRAERREQGWGNPHLHRQRQSEARNVTTPAPNGTIVSVTLTAANGQGRQLRQSGDGQRRMQVSFTSNSTGTVTGHAAANVTFGGETFHVETAGLAGNSGDAVKRFVNAKIAIAPDDVNRVGESHTFTVTLSKDTVTVTIDLSNLNAVIPEPFVDVKLFKLIVITCNESTDTLVDSEVH
jgi:hypothetical protein